MGSLGLIHLYMGEGKGKTTAALGLALRAWGQGLRISVIQFTKSVHRSGEFKAIQGLEGIDISQFGTGRFITDNGPTEEDCERAEEGLKAASRALAGGGYDMVILDEINIALYYRLIGLDDVIEALQNRAPEVEVVITGRNPPEELIDLADYVTEFKLIKHPFDKGVEARKGVEY